MELKPFPCERKASFDPQPDLESNRNIYCDHYDGCLNVAVKSGWGDWTCSRCPLKHLGKRPTAGVFAHNRSRDRSWP